MWIMANKFKFKVQITIFRQITEWFFFTSYYYGRVLTIADTKFGPEGVRNNESWGQIKTNLLFKH